MTTKSANRRKDVAAKLVPQAAKASEAKGKSKVMARETASAYSLTLKGKDRGESRFTTFQN
jgi:hypothetical protein